MTKGLAVKKFSATGNTFVLLDRRIKNLKDKDLPVLAERLSRELATDGLVVVSQTNLKNSVNMTFFNPDGSRAFCGNGTRTAGFYEMRHVLKKKSGTVTVKSDAGDIEVGVKGNQAGLLKMPPPRLISPSPLQVGMTHAGLGAFYRVWSGCPHAVAFVNRVKDLDVEQLGRKVRWNKGFEPEGTNVDFVEVLGPGRLRLRTYERGVERETRSCGSGVLAAALAARELSKVKEFTLAIETQGGPMTVRTNGGFSLEGKVELIFEGVFYI